MSLKYEGRHCLDRDLRLRDIDEGNQLVKQKLAKQYPQGMMHTLIEEWARLLWVLPFCHSIGESGVGFTPPYSAQERQQADQPLAVLSAPYVYHVA